MPRKVRSTEGPERLMLMVLVSRDPQTGRFHFESAIREDHGALVPDVIRDGSPTRFAWSLCAWATKALDHLIAMAVERWDDEFSRESVDAGLLAATLVPPTD